MADKLTIYRGVARDLGHAAGVASLTEASQLRRTIDDAWDAAVSHLLAQGLWNFAMRSVELAKDEDMTPLFGYVNAFSKPEDWVRTAGVSDTDDFNTGFEEYDDETDYWYASVDPLYVRYVSNDSAYGLNIAAWRQPFAKALQSYLAFECSMTVAGADRNLRNDMWNLFNRRLKDAKTLDAVDERVKRRPAGRLAQSRLQSRTARNG